jgi:hypothetical protein
MWWKLLCALWDKRKAKSDSSFQTLYGIVRKSPAKVLSINFLRWTDIVLRGLEN